MERYRVKLCSVAECWLSDVRSLHSSVDQCVISVPLWTWALARVPLLVVELRQLTWVKITVIIVWSQLDWTLQVKKLYFWHFMQVIVENIAHTCRAMCTKSISRVTANVLPGKKRNLAAIGAAERDGSWISGRQSSWLCVAFCCIDPLSVCGRNDEWREEADLTELKLTTATCVVSGYCCCWPRRPSDGRRPTGRLCDCL